MGLSGIVNRLVDRLTPGSTRPSLPEPVQVQPAVGAARPASDGLDPSARYVVLTGGDGGYGNLGDELLLASTKDIYRSLPDGYKVVVLKLRPPDVDDGFINIRDDAAAWAAFGIPVDQIALLHYYGGGYLVDYWYDVKMWLYHHLMSAGLSPTKVVFTGQGILPLEAERLDELKNVARECALFGYRDIGFERLHLAGRLTFDDTASFFCAADTAPVVPADVLTISIRIEHYVGLTSESLDRALGAIRAHAEACGLRAVAFGMVKGPSFDEHRELEQALLARGIGDISVLPRPADASELKLRLRRSRVVVTTSYHVALFALYCGVPSIGLFANEYYRNKFEGLQDTVGGPFFRAVSVDSFGVDDMELAYRESAAAGERDALARRLAALQELNRSAAESILELAIGS